MSENSESPKAGSQLPGASKEAAQISEPAKQTASQPDVENPQTAKAAKPKLEDKPFDDFIRNHLLPDIEKAITEKGYKPSTLELIQGDRPVVGGSCWMIYGAISPDRQFWLCFASDSIASKKTISLADSGTEPSLLEPFLIDEKKMTLQLLRSRLMQRLNGQQWFGAS